MAPSEAPGTVAGSETPDGMIELHSLHVSLEGTVVLVDVSHSVPRGSWLGIIGANGAGKTTLLRAMARQLPYTGRIAVTGVDAHTISPRRFARIVAFVPQKPELPRDMSVIEYVTLGRTPHLGYFGAEGRRDKAVCESLVYRLGLETMAGRALGSLSGGELQRLVLARALAQEAPILLLDEPTSALDLDRRIEALELIDELRVERDLTVLSAIHDLTLAAQFTDQLLLLSKGVVASVGTPAEVLNEGSLQRHFGPRVQVLKTDSGEIVVVPRRDKYAKGSNE